MNLTDREILELNELCNAMVDGTITDAQHARLSTWLLESEPAREYYVRAVGQSASLHSYAAEMHAEAAQPEPISFWSWSRRSVWIAGALAAAACMAIVFLAVGQRFHPDVRSPNSKSPVYVARLSAARETKWSGSDSLIPGALLHKGQHLELAKGFAEVTFDSGARVVLEGPTSFVINSAWDSTLTHGTLKASVPPQAIGFRVVNRSVDITDLGTEFTMSANADGITDVLVLKGEVEAAPRSADDQNTILLKESDARRFEVSGVSTVSKNAENFARFAEFEPVNRFSSDFHYAHWSFDETSTPMLGRYAGAVTNREITGALEGAPANLAQARTGGQWQQALRFDGELRARTSFPGLSELTPHTISFWVKVSEDSPLSDAYAMVAWRANTPRLAYRPVQISWNRNPNEGALGALRTDFSGGCALGTTSLRDGRWHHVTVVVTPNEEASIPLQVKQYVDGRLESSTIIPGRFRGPAGVADAEMNDVVWLGCRLGNTGPRQERFRGELDELYIADRALAPQEIVQVMTENRIPASAIARADAPTTVAKF
ncbi:MAG: LamG-like jellyroll fold domain-containing protein [Opitutus sp.]